MSKFYDIVRIGENNIKPNDTNAEAQLISGLDITLFTKVRIVCSVLNESQIQLLEHFITINNPQYLENLRKSWI
ncbi:hypothetical protein [Limosilactobacillus fermentum]